MVLSHPSAGHGLAGSGAWPREPDTLRLGLSFLARQGAATDRVGARIEAVLAGSPAAEAGLRRGDLLTHWNGRSLVEPLPDEAQRGFRSGESLPVQRVLALARELKPGDRVELRYRRGREERSTEVTARDVVARSTWEGWEGWSLRAPALPGEGGEVRLWLPGWGPWRFSVPRMEIRWGEGPGGRGRQVWLWGRGGPVTLAGVTFVDLNPALGSYFSTDRGALVLEAEEGSPLGLRGGDVLQSVDGRRVESARDAWRILTSYEPGERFSLGVWRQGREVRLEGTLR